MPNGLSQRIQISCVRLAIGWITQTFRFTILLMKHIKGEVITNMNEILTNGTAEFQLMLAENKAGTLKLLSVKEIHEPSFLDFMIGNT